jgi:hypothetical protein
MGLRMQQAWGADAEIASATGPNVPVSNNKSKTLAVQRFIYASSVLN